MSPLAPITFVVAVNTREILDANFLASPCLQGPHAHQIIIQENFSSAAKAYNDAIDKSLNDLIVFCHADVFLPENWISKLEQALNYLAVHDPKWGVLGCGGMNPDGTGWGHIYSTGLGVTGEPFEKPGLVQTLDEIVLILRKSSGLRFDDTLPNFHMYGTDICLRAAKIGMKSYTIDAFLIHNTHQNLILAKEFYESASHIKRVWKDALPIQTTCIRLTRFNIPLYRRKLHEIYLRYIRRKEFDATRVKDVLRLHKQIGARP
jgi:hypothetical protein